MTSKTAIIVLFMVSSVVYLNSLPNGFVYDDLPQVVQNPRIQDPSSLPDIFLTDVWSFSGRNASNYYRPVMYLIFTADYHLFGLNPLGFHLTSVLLHAGVTVMVFLITSFILGSPSRAQGGTENDASPAAGGRGTAFFAALLFATHPVHTEAVAWVSGVPELSFTLFYLLSFYFYIREDRPGLSLVFFLLAALSKETALTLPLVMAAYDRCFGKGLAFYSLLKRYLPYLAVAALYFAVRSYVVGGLAPVNVHAGLSAYEQFINVFPLFAQHLGKLLLPMNLNVTHTFHPISSMLEWRGILSLFAAAAFMAAVWLLMRRSPTAAFGLLLVAVPLLPALYIPALGEHAFAERYLYMPSVGFVI
ncbi:MAG: hypothetical protein V3W31_04595, partial [Thermodesulfobacteriota bacterium]